MSKKPAYRLVRCPTHNLNRTSRKCYNHLQVPNLRLAVPRNSTGASTWTQQHVGFGGARAMEMNFSLNLIQLQVGDNTMQAKETFGGGTTPLAGGSWNHQLKQFSCRRSRQPHEGQPLQRMNWLLPCTTREKRKLISLRKGLRYHRVGAVDGTLHGPASIISFWISAATQ